MKYQTRRKGIVLVEVICAVTIVSIALVSITTALLQSSRFYKALKENFKANLLFESLLSKAKLGIGIEELDKETINSFQQLKLVKAGGQRLIIFMPEEDGN